MLCLAKELVKEVNVLIILCVQRCYRSRTRKTLLPLGKLERVVTRPWTQLEITIFIYLMSIIVVLLNTINLKLTRNSGASSPRASQGGNHPEAEADEEDPGFSKAVIYFPPLIQIYETVAQDCLTLWQRWSCYVAVPGFNHFWPVSTSCLKSETASECHSLKRKQRGSTEEVLPQSCGLRALLNTHSVTHTFSHPRPTLPHCQTGTCVHTHTHTFSLTDTHWFTLSHTQTHRGLQQGLLGNIRHPGRKEDRLFPHLESMDTSDVRLKIEPTLTKAAVNQLQQQACPTLNSVTWRCFNRRSPNVSNNATHRSDNMFYHPDRKRTHFCVHPPPSMPHDWLHDTHTHTPSNLCGH